jgi:hypothetical protein
MDINVNFQGLKYNFEKIRSVFTKLPGAGYFLDFMNYFSKEKSCGIGPRSVNRSTATGPSTIE